MELKEPESETAKKEYFSKSEDGSGGQSIVTYSPGLIEVGGKAYDKEGEVTSIKGILAYKRSEEASKYLVETTGFFNKALSKLKKTDTYDIGNLDAKPGGMRVGNILTYTLAEQALENGVEYITAGKVSGARQYFYTPLGFKDFLGQPAWTALEAERKEVLAKAVSDRQDIDIPKLVKRKKQLDKLMENNKIFIKSGDLLTKSKEKLLTKWQPVEDSFI